MHSFTIQNQQKLMYIITDYCLIIFANNNVFLKDYETSKIHN